MKNNEDFLNALRLNEEWAYEALYRDYYPMVLKYVLQNSGEHEAARDLFQEVVIAVIRNIRNPDFELYDGTKFGTYLMSIAQKKWLAGLQQNKNKKTVDLEDQVLDWRDVEESYTSEDREIQYGRMERALDQIGMECREIILSYYYNHVPLNRIAGIMGYTQAFVRVKKNRCMNRLRELITIEH
ncbi:MAG: sigma-70 family RNA polymerase sigma factor [Saprospiraceae bacterium]|nr:sigma-70 family RNA polymerase sigma factor [Saprospiraceae bacterium]HMX88841.1 sigma-70 family RNA polymerase sigma factor [Saprospiraceae bacterium]HMZ39295.1 sigma-70 family RNA polymerase sigma factor [Saprospiraceae bacterium]HNA64115.1 sigma-70 family RNA polymerase sigma factor [Saprospiraceae bacterium]HNB31475.1 sigma-70 family RNA polymerase sigma factor [Saprospiraceae bacterium]